MLPAVADKSLFVSSIPFWMGEPPLAQVSESMPLPKVDFV